MPVATPLAPARRATAWWQSPHWLAAGVTLAGHALALAALLHAGSGQVHEPAAAASEQAGLRVQLRFVAPATPSVAVAAAAPTAASAALEQPAPGARGLPPAVATAAQLPAPRPEAVLPANVHSGPAAGAAGGQDAPAMEQAPPPVHPVATRQAAPAQGIDGTRGTDSAARAGAPPAGEGDADWALAVMQRLEKFRVYPAAARARRIQGTVLVRAVIAADGRVVEARLGRSCGNADLDAEAVATFHRARRLPPPPPHLRGAPLQVDLPVAFSLS